MLEPVQKQLAQSDQKQVGVVKSRLIQAGYYHPSSVEIYYSTRVTLAVGLAVAAALAIWLLLPPVGANAALFLILGGATLGYYLPALVLQIRIKDRQTAFRYGMPDAMDMILVGVEAGLSLPASIKHLCDEFADAHPIIAEQFRMVTLEFQAGKSRPDALASLAKRMDVQEARIFSTMIAQAETLGTSLATTLRVLADEMRRDRMLKAETKAAELPVKMAIPLVLLIFPALFSVIMTPLVIRILRAFSSVVG
jgi:tight adherence protein C